MSPYTRAIIKPNGFPGGDLNLFKYYMGICVMCLIFAVVALFFSANAGTMAVVYLSMAGAFLAIAFVTSGRESRW
jgi:hypothetical protein